MSNAREVNAFHADEPAREKAQSSLPAVNRRLSPAYAFQQLRDMADVQGNQLA